MNYRFARLITHDIGLWDVKSSGAQRNWIGLVKHFSRIFPHSLYRDTPALLPLSPSRLSSPPRCPHPSFSPSPLSGGGRWTVSTVSACEQCLECPPLVLQMETLLECDEVQPPLTCTSSVRTAALNGGCWASSHFPTAVFQKE